MAEEKKRTMADEPEEEEREREPEKERAEEKVPPRPAGPVRPPLVFNRTVRAWMWLTAFSLGASVFFPLSWTETFLGRSFGFRLGALEFTYALIPGVAVMLGAVWALFKAFGSSLDYAKPGQGRWVRLGGYAGLGLLAFFAAITLHQAPSLNSRWWQELWQTEVLGAHFALRPIFFPSATLFLAAMIAYHLFMNRPAWADFLIETQAEMRKVSWPARREWVGSSVVVIVVIAFISLFLYFADEGLSKVMQKLGIGF